MIYVGHQYKNKFDILVEKVYNISMTIIVSVILFAILIQIFGQKVGSLLFAFWIIFMVVS